MITSVFRIRFHWIRIQILYWIRIRIQRVAEYGSNPDPASNPTKIFMTKFVKKLESSKFLDQKPSSICLHKPLQRTFRLFKHEISSFFLFLGGQFRLRTLTIQIRIRWPNWNPYPKQRLTINQVLVIVQNKRGTPPSTIAEHLSADILADFSSRGEKGTQYTHISWLLLSFAAESSVVAHNQENPHTGLCHSLL